MKKGKNVRTHFAHESLKSCDFYHENEGPEHLENKVALLNWAKKDAEVEMEYPIPELKQIADIFINKQLALEVQCSPISCALLARAFLPIAKELEFPNFDNHCFSPVKVRKK